MESLKDARILAAEQARGAAFQAHDDAAVHAASKALAAVSDRCGSTMRPMPRPLAIGDDVCLLIGGAVGLTCVVVETIHARVTKATDKAVELTDHEGRAAWYPRKALVKQQASGYGTCHASIAHWLRPSWSHRQQWSKANVGGVSAAF